MREVKSNSGRRSAVHRWLVVVAVAALAFAGMGATSGAVPRHTIRPGETLASIAAKYHTTVAALAAANGINRANRIFVGKSLVIPAPRAAPITNTQLTGGHVVKPGETLRGIAAAYGLAPSVLASYNGIVDGRLYAGARLLLQSPGTYAPAAGGDGHYTVARGDTLSRIAGRFHTSIAALVAANHLSNANLVRIGRVLVVPGAGAGFLCPVPGSHFVNDWGFPRDGHWHEGNDMMAARGTAVRAPVAGTVAYLTGSIAGLEFRLVTRDGTYFIGSHMMKAGKVGRVAAGDVIGYVSNTGNAEGGPAHLHFEIHPRGGAAVDPYPIIRAACG
jgi:LysM repeat protein